MKETTATPVDIYIKSYTLKCLASLCSTAMNWFCLGLAFLALFAQIDGAKVLGVLPFGSSSHFAIGSAILKSLHEAGHEITVVSPYPQKKPLEKYHDIPTTEILTQHSTGKFCLATLMTSLSLTLTFLLQQRSTLLTLPAYIQFS